MFVDLSVLPARICTSLCLALGLVSAPVLGQAILGSYADGNLAVVFPTPGIDLPTPAQTVVSGFPAGSGPHGVDYFGSDSALVSDFGASRIFQVQVSTASLVATIDTTGFYSGVGTIKVAPSRDLALAMGGLGQPLTVIHAPFDAGATLDSVTMPGSIFSYQTQAIVFDAAGRAFVYHTTGISVLDPPYTSIAFTIPVVNASSGAIAITPDGNTLLATRFSNAVLVFTAPFSAASVPQILLLAGSSGLDGIAVTPDGQTALVVSAVEPQVFAVEAPFGIGSSSEGIPLPAGLINGFEDVGISADGSVAILTGNSVAPDREPAVFVEAPFTAAGATVHEVSIGSGATEGRGTGAVRFLPPGLAPGLTIGKSDSPDPVSSGGQITYTITYGNSGAVDATNVVIRDPIPAGTTFVSATNGGTPSAGTVVWNVGTVPADTTGLVVSLVVQVTAAPGSRVDNVNYTIEGEGISPIPGPPVQTEVAAAATSADLAILKSDSPDPVDIGDSLTYTLQVTNNGPDAASLVVVEDTLPAGVTFQSASGSGWSCGEAGGVVTCTTATLAVGPAAPITILVTAPAVPGTLSNSATVSAATEDPWSDNDSDAETTSIGVAAVPTLSHLGVMLLSLIVAAMALQRLRG
jgi:uncharacterized repeat protein (TIGR01451 family)